MKTPFDNENTKLMIVVIVCFLMTVIMGLGFALFALRTKQDIQNFIANYPIEQRIDQKVNEAVEQRLQDIPKPQNGKNGSDGSDGTNGRNGKDAAKAKDGTDGANGAKGDSCTTKDTEAGADIICEDGTTTSIEDGTDAREREQCLLPGGLFGWRYVNTLTCLKVLP